jgi:hypothetical protein
MVMMLQKSGTSVIKPSVAANFPMQKAMLKYMINNRIDAIYHITSTKSGVKSPPNVYNSDGSLNPKIEDSSYYMDLKYLKTQIQMPANGKEKSTVSTQARNLLASYLPEEVIKNFDELQVQNIKNRLLSTYYKYGLTDTNVENFRALTTDLADQAKNAGHSDNVVRAIRNFNPNEFFIESLPNHNLIDSNTHAFLRKTLIKETRSGISAYQVSSTFWEKANRDVNANNESALKWYSLKEDGTLTPAETIIPLPWEIVDGISKATGETNLERIVDIANRGDKYKFEFWSARIPGQSKASLDWYKVKTFISPLMQNMQVVPTETIAKNGSDFDGDKSFNYFPEFDSKGLVDAEHSNTILNRAEIEMLAHPDSRLLLFEPVGVEPLIEAKEQSLSDEQKTLVDRPTFADLMKPETTAFNSWIFLSTKDGTGAMANFIKAAIIGNKYGLKLKESVTMIDPISEEEITLDQKLPFEGDNLDLSTSFNGDGRTKSSELSVGITSQVDGIKSPYAALLNLTGDGLNIAGYLLMRGVSIPTVAAFLTQPIITEFLKNERKRKGPLAKFIGGRELKTIKVESSQDIKQRLMSGLAYPTATEVLPKTLGAENLTYLANNNKNQQELLSLFLRVQDLANLFRPVIQYISADTSKLSRFTQTYDFFRDVVEVIKDPGNRINPLENPEILMENNTMTGAFISARERFYAPFLNWHISNQSVTENIVEALLNKYTSGFTPSKIKTETRTKLTDLLVKYIVQNFNSEFRGKFESAINEAGEMISNIKRDAAHPLNNNSFISRVVIDSSDGYMAPKLKTRANNAVESRALVNGVIEIKDKKPELYEALAMVIPFLPTVSSSLYNLEPFMPFEKLFSTQSIVKQVIRPAVDTSGFIPAKFAINIGNAIRTLEAAYPKMLPQEWERGRRGRDNDRNKLYYNSDTQEVVDYDGNPVKPRAGFSYLNLLAENVASEVPVKASTNYLQATRKSNSALAEKITSSIYSPEIKVNELTGQTMDRLDGAGWVKAAATLILLANEDMPSTQVYDTLMTLEPNENYKTLGWYATIFSSLNTYKNAAPVFRKIVLNQLPSRADFEIDPSHVIDKLLSYGVITANPRSGSYEVSNGGIPYTLNTNESLDESNVENEAPLLAENLKTLKAVSARYGNALSLIGRQGSTILTTNFNQLNENNKDELTNKCNII